MYERGRGGKYAGIDGRSFGLRHRVAVFVGLIIVWRWEFARGVMGVEEVMWLSSLYRLS